MATINRLELQEDIKLYMRSDNIFSDSQMMKFAEKVIADVGDDQENYEEVLCKSLKSIAINNKAQVVNSGGIKTREIEDVIREDYYQDDNSGTWDSYLESLPDVCTGFGYTGLSVTFTGFIKVNTDGGTASVDDKPFIDVNPTSSSNNLIYPL